MRSRERPETAESLRLRPCRDTLQHCKGGIWTSLLITIVGYEGSDILNNRSKPQQGMIILISHTNAGLEPPTILTLGSLSHSLAASAELTSWERLYLD